MASENLDQVKKIDVGCGQNKRDGFFGLDITQYEGVDMEFDARWNKLPFKDNQLEHIYCSHFMEHLTFDEAIFTLNEFYRVLMVGGKLEIVVPHAMSYAQVTDLSHKSAWTEDTFGYITPENKYYYSWFYTDPKTNERMPVINKWKILKNDQTPPYEYTPKGWVELKLREVHAFLEKTE